MSQKYGNKFEITAVLLAVMIALVLLFQARSLYIFPQPDSARWWGDETPQMLELRAEVHDGYAHIPTALGSSVAITNGLIRGNSWLAAGIYGIPASLVPSSYSIVSVGRTITFLLSLILIAVLYRVLRRFEVERALALLAILILVTTRSFFIASHAARLDIAAGVAVLAFVWYLSSRYDLLRQDRWIPGAGWFFFYGTIALLFATLSIHLLTLLALLSIYTLWRFRALHHPIVIVAALGGVVIVLALLLTIYALSGAPVSLYSPSIASNQFQSVISGLPILRPFSRSVQVANILERVQGLWSEAPQFLIFLIGAVIIIFSKRRQHPVTSGTSFIFGSAIVIAISWLLFQSPALYYYVHVLPLFILAFTIAVGSRLNKARLSQWIATGLGILLCYCSISDAVTAKATATIIENNNKAALHAVVQAIDTTSGARPTVLAQNPAIAYLEHQPNVRLITAHLVSFPVSKRPLADVLESIPVQYLLLYKARDRSDYSLDYHDLKPIADSIGSVILQKSGILFDVHRDYFNPATFLDSDTSAIDTLILYRLPVLAR